MTVDIGFDVDYRHHGPVVEIAPRGELDITTAETLLGAVEEATEAEVELLIVDLARVSFVDAIGLTALLRCKLRAEAKGASLELRDVQPFPQRVLDLTGLTTVLGLETRSLV